MERLDLLVNSNAAGCKSSLAFQKFFPVKQHLKILGGIFRCKKMSLYSPLSCLKALKANFYFELFRSSGSSYFLTHNPNLSIFLLSLNVIICYVISTLADFTIGNFGAGAQSKRKNQKYYVIMHTC